ncbi:MAG: autotransporter outer membrane beta-barrel domain-containing protein, partial [Helicobacter sp.]|nr:autotransporter outer membrane beta-barrel domain-containing protein [Helicobacter sp.]
KYTNGSLDFDNGSLDFDSISAGVNYIYDFEAAKLLSGVTVDWGKNKIERRVVGVDDTISADYNNVTTSVQLGLSKDFAVESVTFTPLTYFNYAYIYQENFSESGGLWTKKYQAIKHNTTSLAAGMNIAYNFKSDSFEHILSGFGIYERRLSGVTIKNKARFNDFVQHSFVQQNDLSRNSLSLGASYHLSASKYFLNIGIINDFAKKQSNFSFLGTFGLKF